MQTSNWREHVREEFKVAYSSMPENFESVHPDYISDWWILKMEQVEKESIERAIEVVIGFVPFSKGKISNEVREGMLLGGEAAKKEILSALKTLLH